MGTLLKMKTSETQLAERLEEEIILFGLNHKGICFFGANGSCKKIGYKRIEYCVYGRSEECEHYSEQLKKYDS